MGPGAVVLKITYEHTPELNELSIPRFFYVGEPYCQQVISIEWEYIEEDALYFYVPLLIESLKDLQQGGTGMRALSKLYSIMFMAFPDGYGDYYMHPVLDSYTGTPFERDGDNRYPELDDTSYKKWKEWWETEKPFRRY